MAEKFLIWSEEHGAWWRPSRWGYSQRIRDAGQYSAEQAEQICRDANFGGRFYELAIPVPDGIPPGNPDLDGP